MSTSIYQTKKAVVYQYINSCSPTLKSYVGYTTNFEKRNISHKSAAARGETGYFYNSIRKNGWDNFIPKILSESDDVEYARNVLEPYYIKLCKSFKTENGYNLTYGGGGNSGFHHSEKTKAQMAESHLGRPLSEKHKENISEVRTGKPHSKETKTKIGDGNRGKNIQKKQKRKILNHI
jgi:group I intron endonuclease